MIIWDEGTALIVCQERAGIALEYKTHWITIIDPCTAPFGLYPKPVSPMVQKFMDILKHKAPHFLQEQS
jgi:hypothetical protein